MKSIWETVNYVYNRHFFQSAVKGRYFDTTVCLDVNEGCNDTFSIFAVEETNTEFHTSVDGYLGLGIKDALGNEQSYNVLHQLH